MNRYFITCILILVSLALNGQLDLGKFLPPGGKSYQNHVAIQFNGKLLADEYDPRSECRIAKETTGKITVGPVNMNNTTHTEANQIQFMVAIHNTRTNTKWMYTTEAVKEVYLEYVLAKCEPGDKIVFIVMNQRYRLPYNELELAWEC